MSKRSKLLAPSSIIGATTAAVATYQFIADESGILDFAKMHLQGTFNPALIADNIADPNSVVFVSGIFLNGSQVYVRGRVGAPPSVPLDAWSTERQADLLGLPELRVKSSDRITVVLDLPRSIAFLAGIGMDWFGGMPFYTDDLANQRNVAMPGTKEVAAASGNFNVPNGNVSTATFIEFDSPGVIDLNRLWLGAVTDAAVAAGTDYNLYSDVKQLKLQQMILRNDYNMIVGQTDPATGIPVAASAGVFAPKRQLRFWEPGQHQVTPGDRLTLTFAQSNPTASGYDIQFGVPLYPTGGAAIGTGNSDKCGC